MNQEQLERDLEQARKDADRVIEKATKAGINKTELEKAREKASKAAQQAAPLAKKEAERAKLLQKQREIQQEDLNKKKFFKFNTFTKPVQKPDAIQKSIIETITGGAGADTLTPLSTHFSLDPESNKIKPKIVIAYDLNQQLESELAKYKRKLIEYLNSNDYIEEGILTDKSIREIIQIITDHIVNLNAQQEKLFMVKLDSGEDDKPPEFHNLEEIGKDINPYRSLEINRSSGLLPEIGKPDETLLSVYTALQTPLDLITHIQYLKTQPPPEE